MAVRLVLAAHSTTYEPCSPYAQHKNEVAGCMIQIITEKARSMMNDSQAQLVVWGQVVHTAVYLHEQITNTSVT